MAENDRLYRLLRELSNDQLEVVWTTDLRKKPKAKGFHGASKGTRHRLVSNELRSAAGHTLANVIRKGPELSWRTVLGLSFAALVEGSNAEDLDREAARWVLAEAIDARGLARLEGLVLGAVDLFVSSHAQEKALEARIEEEDRLLHSSHLTANMGEILFQDQEGQWLMIAAGLAGAALVWYRPAGAVIVPALSMMEPSFHKVVPAVARILTHAGIEPVPFTAFAQS